jgi:hypothetical protein
LRPRNDCVHEMCTANAATYSDTYYATPVRDTILRYRNLGKIYCSSKTEKLCQFTVFSLTVFLRMCYK